jgi:hypothetical protein
MHVSDEALHALATQPRCHSHGSLAGTSPALISAGDHPRKLCCQAFAVTPQGRLDYAYGRSGCAVTYHPVQPSFLTVRRPSSRLPSVAIVQLAPGRRAAADVTVQRIVVQEGSHLCSVTSSQRLQRQARRLDHVGRGPLRLDQHPPTLSRISAPKLTAGEVRASHRAAISLGPALASAASRGGHQLIGRCRVLKGLDEDAEAAERASNALFPLGVAEEDDGFAAEEGKRDEVGEIGGRQRAERA